MKLLPYIFFEKYVYTLLLEMADLRSQHCVNCIGTLFFSIPSISEGTGYWVTAVQFSSYDVNEALELFRSVLRVCV